MCEQSSIARVQTGHLSAAIFHGSILRKRIYYVMNSVVDRISDTIRRTARMAGCVTLVIVGALGVLAVSEAVAQETDVPAVSGGQHVYRAGEWRYLAVWGIRSRSRWT